MILILCMPEWLIFLFPLLKNYPVTFAVRLFSKVPFDTFIFSNIQVLHKQRLPVPWLSWLTLMSEWLVPV